MDNLFRQLEFGESNFITIVRRDGAFLMRSPYLDSAAIKPDQYTNQHAGFDLINQGVMSGTYVTTAEKSLVGLTRINAFKVLPDYPLVVLVGISREEALRDAFQLQITYNRIAIYLMQNSSTDICNRRIPKVAKKKCRCLQQCRKTNAS